MTTVYEIPTSAEPQKFRITLAGTDYYMRLVWNAQAAYWVMDLMDEDEVLVLAGVPLVTGVDLLGQYEHLGIGGGLVVQTDHNPDAVPTLENLGTTGHLYFVTEP